MKFVKMHGTGNDFVLIDARKRRRDWPRLAKALCDRHFGVGADGLLLVQSSSRADLRMRMFNPDGSEAEACGNGLRCFAKYAVEMGLVPGKTALTVETKAGKRSLRPEIRRGRVVAVKVSLGKPRFQPEEIPVLSEKAKGQVALDGGRLLTYAIGVGGRELRLSCLSMGNPHAVLFSPEPVASFPLASLGLKVEHHPLFPQRVNFEVVNVRDREHLEVRVWERGAGETLACGSGAGAVAVAAQLKGYTGNKVYITLAGGTLTIEWDGKGEVYLQGPAETVFHGEWPEEASAGERSYS